MCISQGGCFYFLHQGGAIMTTEQGHFDHFERPEGSNDPTVLPAYPDMLYANGTQITDELRAFLRPAEHQSIPSASEPAGAQQEPQTPSWSYERNPLFAALPADVEKRMAQESTPIFDELTASYAAPRLRDRILSQVEIVAEPAAEYVQQEAAPQETPIAPSRGLVNLMAQGLRASAQAKPAAEQVSPVLVAADLPINHTPYYPPVSLWEAPRRMSDDNVGLENAYMRGPLPDSITPRLAVQQETQHTRAAEAFAARHVFDQIEETAATPAVHVEEQPPVDAVVPVTPLIPGAAKTFLSRIKEQAHAVGVPDSETTQVLSIEQLAATVASEQAVVSPGEQLVSRVAAEATVATLEQKPARTIRSYGQTLLEAAGFRFRMKRDETGEGYHGEIVDSEGTVQIDKIDMSKNAEGERMRTTRRLIGRMARMGMRIPRLPSPRAI
jgi:hypothetical protein